MKAIQIVIKGDERSEEYSYLSRRSFQRAIDDGYIDSIETFDAITPQSEDFQDHVDKYVWSKSLMTLDTLSGNGKDDHSPSEKAGMCSHWELMRQQGESDEKFWIMEHDTYLIEERYECDTIGVGRDIGIYFNLHDKHKTGIPTPTTQLISKRLSVTQDHHGYKDIQQQEPWTRHKFFKVID